MEFTVTTDLQRATTKDANGARKHNEHDPNVKHDNVQIIKEDTELNQHTVLVNRNKLLEQQYGAMIKKRNDSTRQRFLDGKIGQAEYQQRLTNIDKYLNDEGKKPKQAFTTYVFTLGNVDTEFKLLDALGFKYERQKVKDKQGKVHDRPKLTDPKQRKEFADIMNETYVNLAKRINGSKSAGIKIVDVWTHMDEGGMPHAQGEIVNMGHTASGKPSYNLNQALAEFNKAWGSDVYVSNTVNKQGKKYKSPNGSIALKNFRSLIDGNMVETFNEALKKRGLDKKVTASMIRLGRKGGYTMEEYQSRQQANKALSDVYEAVVGHKPEKALTPLEMAHNVSKAVKQSKQDKEQADIDKSNAEQEAQQAQQARDDALTEQQDLMAQKTALQQQINDLKADEEDQSNQIKQRKQRLQRLEQEVERNTTLNEAIKKQNKRMGDIQVKAQEYDKIKKMIGEIPPKHTLSSYIKSNFDFLKQQASIGMKLLTDFDKVKGALVDFLGLHKVIKPNDISHFKNGDTTDELKKIVDTEIRKRQPGGSSQEKSWKPDDKLPGE